MEITYYRNGNIQGTVNDTAAYAQKHGVCMYTHRHTTVPPKTLDSTYNVMMSPLVLNVIHLNFPKQGHLAALGHSFRGSKMCPIRGILLKLK